MPHYQNTHYPSNAAIVLSNDINPDGTLRPDVQRRVDFGVSLFGNHVAPYLVMSGEYGGTDQDAIIKQADAMRLYAIGKGVPRTQCLPERKGFSTVGQAYFLMRDFIIPNNWEKVCAITSDFHVPRVQEILGHIFGPDIGLVVDGVYSGGIADNPDKIAGERRRIDAFKESWGKIPAGDMELFREKLYTDHTWYKGRQDEYETPILTLEQLAGEERPDVI